MSPEESELRRIDREWNEAYPRRDVEALGRILADDWTCVDGSGRLVSKAELIERVASNPNPFDSHEFDEFTLRVYGDAAVVTGRLTGRGREGGREFVLSQRYTRVYARRGGAWQAVATQVTVVSEP